MEPVRRIDLHMHTTFSDGTDTPEELLQNVREAGITLFSVTDHDSIGGAARIRKLRTDADPLFVEGVEFSCRDEEGKYHILGYGYDPLAPSILKLTGETHMLRMKKVRRRLEILRDEYSVQFPDEEVEKLLQQENPGKPHIANLMVRYGFAGSKDEAIKDVLNKIRLHSEYLRPEKAIQGILEAGGVPVLAHPFYGSGDELVLGEEMEARLRKLIGFGLEGVEAFYSGFTDKLKRDMLAYAEQFGLYVTAGSDYHGSNKLVVLGDTGLRETTEIPEGLRKFIGRIMK